MTAKLGRPEIVETLRHVADERLLENNDDATQVEHAILNRAADFFEGGPIDTMELAGLLVDMSDVMLPLGEAEGIDPAVMGMLAHSLLDVASTLRDAARKVKLPTIN